MPSEKRARQRALREQKQAVIAKSRKRRTALRRGIGIVVLGAVIVLVVILVSGNSKKSATTSTTTTSTTTAASTAPTTQPLTTKAVTPTCPPASGSTTRVVLFTAAPPHCIPATSVWDATFKTTVGDIVVKMDAAKSYAAVNNFVFLARYQYFNGTFFHRVIPGFVVQGGDPAGTGTGIPAGSSSTVPFPGYRFTGNFPPESCTTTPTGPGCYVPGDLVLANGNSNPKVQNASTNGSQFFFVLPGGQTTLNTEPTYTLFGSVTSGMSVVEKIGSYGTSSGPPTVKVYVDSVTVKQLSG